MIDTNVLIVASAAHIGNVELQDVTPNDPVLCQQVLDWMIEFERSDSVWLFDSEGAIDAEYRGSRFLDSGSYAFQVLNHKHQMLQVDFSNVELDENGKAVLTPELQELVHDTSDRIMVATAYGKAIETRSETIANASDTDWYSWEEGLRNHGVLIEQLIPEWSRAKFLEKEAR